MNIFNRMVPWFIPTKNDQRKWYTEEIGDIPKEKLKILDEFQHLSQEYNARLGNFESALTKDFKLYEEYIEIKFLAQKVNFLWNRIEYKTSRENDLKRFLSELK